MKPKPEDIVAMYDAIHTVIDQAFALTPLSHPDVIESIEKAYTERLAQIDPNGKWKMTIDPENPGSLYFVRDIPFDEIKISLKFEEQ